MKRTFRSWPARAFVAALLAGGATSLAEETSVGSDAEEAFATARARFDAGDFAGAVAALEPFGADPALPLPGRALLGGLYLELARPDEALAILGPLAERADADPAVLYNAGRAALAGGDDARARRWLERSAALAPGSPASRQLAFLLGRMGDEAGAYRQLRAWLASNTDDLPARLAAAYLAVDLGRLDDAERWLDGLTRGPRVILLRADIALRRGRPEEAIALLEPQRAEASGPLAADLANLLGEAYLTVGRSADALALVADGSGEDPRLALIAAQARFRTGDLEGALAALAPWAGRDDVDAPRRARIALEHGRHLLVAGRHAEAVAQLERAVALDSGAAEGWQLLSQARLASGQRAAGEEALARFRELSERRPGQLAELDARERALADPTGAAIEEARQLLAEGRGEEALGRLAAEVELAPDDPRPVFESIRLLIALQRLDEAHAIATTLVERLPESADAHYLAGAVHLAALRRAEAERALRRAIELAPGHTAAMNDLGIALLVEGRREDARELFEKVLALRPDDPVAKENLERLKSASGTRP
jgi:tetratricopeptide (TPR) repeat protein